MTIGDLLKPRYKVIAIWPGYSITAGVGTIIPFDDEFNLFWVAGNPHTPEDMKFYPHLFQPLQWWEDRTIMDLPDYIKWKSPGTDEISFFKVNNWYSSPNSFDIAGCDVDAGRLFIKDCLPATESEYQSYINTKLYKLFKETNHGEEK